MRYYELNESFIGRFEVKKATPALKQHSDESFAELEYIIHVPRKLDPHKVEDLIYKITNSCKLRATIRFDARLYTNEFTLKIAGSVLRLKMAVNYIDEFVDKAAASVKK